MSLKIGETVTISLAATLAGAPGSFEGSPSIDIQPATAVTGLAIAADNLSAAGTVAEAAEITVTVTVDNLQGDAVGALVGTAKATLLPADPVVLADTLNVTVS